GDDPAERADAALRAAGGEARGVARRSPAGPGDAAQAAGGQGDGGDGGGDQTLGLVAHRVAGHAAASGSTRFFSAVNAGSMIAFSGLRLNMPSIAIASSTESVEGTVEEPSPLSAMSYEPSWAFCMLDGSIRCHSMREMSSAYSYAKVYSS